LFVNVLAALCLATGALSLYVNPNTFIVPAFFGLTFLLWLLINTFFFFFWMVVRFKYISISFGAILISFPLLMNYFSFHFGSNDPASSTAFKVMTYNVRNFDLYNWKSGEKTLVKIMEQIKEQQPDILCVQEFFNADSGKYQTIKTLMKEAGFTSFRFDSTVSRKKYGGWGVATFSRFPIVNSGVIHFPNSKLNSSLFTDVKIHSDTLRIFNVHLQSVYLSNTDYEYIEHVAEDHDVQVKPTQKIFSKLKSAFTARAAQALQMKVEMAKSPYRILVCGDFNDTPASFCYHTMSSHLNDAFLCTGFGIGPTYSGFFTPYRIDYILLDKKLHASDYKTLCEKYSDHYAVTCRISF